MRPPEPTPSDPMLSDDDWNNNALGEERGYVERIIYIRTKRVGELRNWTLKFYFEWSDEVRAKREPSRVTSI